MAKGFFSQGVAALFEAAPDLDALMLDRSHGL